jgi:lipoprotein-anchoring transpeptidase ErfK/SrfK
VLATSKVEADMNRMANKDLRAKSRTYILALTLAMAVRSAAQESGTEATISREPKFAPPASSTRVALVSIPDRQLAVLENGNVIATFPVAVGAASSPSPTGSFQIVSRVANPTYYHPGAVVPGGKNNPVGTRWLGLSRKGYGIHGTNAPKSIGHAASHGCIRLRNRDMERLFPMLRIGDTVEIHGEHDEQIARIFGNGGELAALSAQTAPGQ